ncbi:ABC transporter permease [Ammoniphilus resinae]|uniref:ABC-type multidrug transport system permease subunit n=1 Tax=Ammoniphilus resinae TaxID=861532 RepID=A0ABS4GPK4_9BACL|nr:ABC transporter permease [Ammoniphilus resinae]MBP1932203.1 ABC-type multidrug transport system permease subunit [Ammoniphilus resinae]
MIGTMIFQHIKRYLTDFKALLFMLVIPTLFIVLFSQVLSPYLFSSQFSEPFAIAVVDEDQTFDTEMMIKQLEQTPYMRDFIEVRRTDLPSAKRWLEENQIVGTILLEEGFTKSMYQGGENRPLILIGNPAQKTLVMQLQNQLESATNIASAAQSGIITVWHFAYEGGADPQWLNQKLPEIILPFMTKSLNRNEIFEQETVSDIPKVRLPEYFTAALLVVFLAFLGVRESRSWVEEVESRIWLRLKSTPLPLWKLFAGKFMGSFLVSWLQFALILGVVSFLFRNYLGYPLVWTLSFLTVVVFSITAWTFLISSFGLFTKGAELVGYLGSLLLSIIGGNIYPLYMLHETAQKASDLSFTKWAMLGFLKVFAGDPAVSLWDEILWLTGVGALMLFFSGCLVSLFWRKSA